jgi:hypothetical protein
METPFQQSFSKRVHHPPCVRHLLRYGVPSDMPYDNACTLLVRYIVTKGLNDEQGMKLAQSILNHSDSLNSVRRANDVGKFLGLLSRGRGNLKANRWCCGDIWSNKKLRERGACTGWSCEYYRSDPRGESNRQIVANQAQIERDTLAYLLNNPECIGEGLRLRCEGFVDEYECREGICLPLNRMLWHVCRYLAYHGRPIRRSTILASLSRSPEIRKHLTEIERYVQQLQSDSSCGHGRFIEYLNVINVRGARLRAQDLIRQAGIAVASSALPLDVALNTLGRELSALSMTVSDRNCLFEQDLSDLMTDLFSKRCGLIPTRSEWLNVSLGGGWKPGRLYIVYASSAAEATDFSAWCAEFAAQRRFPTVFVSHGISKEDFAERALARHCHIDTTELSRYREKGYCQDDALILERLVEGGERLSRRIAQYLVMIEADPEITAADVRSAVHTAQKRVGADRYQPILLILDQLPIQLSDENEPSESAQKNSLLVRLKLQMQDPVVAIVAVFSKLVTAREPKLVTEESNKMLFPKDPRGLSAADCILTLQSEQIRVLGTASGKKVNQLDLAREWYKRYYLRFRGHIDRLFDEAEGGHPLDETTSSYARISLFGKGARALANPVIVYERTYHGFRTLNMEPTGFEKHGVLAFDEDSPEL